MSFRKDNKFGEIGENKISKYILSLPITMGIVDVSKDECFQQFDIDFLQITTDGDINKIEVKTDKIADKTGNMVYEKYSNKQYFTKGCFEKTKADYIFYYLININVIYIFNTQELIQWVWEHEHEYELVDMGDSASGYIIKLSDLKDISIKKKI